MAESPTTRRWIGRFTYIGLVLALVFIQLLPLQTTPSRWAPPDFILCLTLVWVARRPDLVPITFIAALFFGMDLLFHRPPGLWTALVLILSEILRARATDLRRLALPMEWLTVTTGIVAITLAYRAVLALVVAPQAPLGLALVEMVMTVVAYPLVAFISHGLFDVSRPAEGEVDSFGRPL